MTILTNGDSGVAAVSSVVPDADVIAWDDVLFEGPVSGGIDLDAVSAGRAAFLQGALDNDGVDRDVLAEFRVRDARLRNALSEATADSGDAAPGEITLWFESDLYDQLQVAQILSLLSVDARSLRVTIVPWQGSLLSGMSGLSEAFAARTELRRDEYRAGRAFWEAFCASEPSALIEFIRAYGGSVVLKTLPAAAQRLVEEYPSLRSGLSRTQRTALEVLDEGPATAGALFQGVLQREQEPFMGDWSFFRAVSVLVRSQPSAVSENTAGPQSLFAITPTGRALLNAACDLSEITKMDRWIGGVHLTNENHWRWDDENRVMVYQTT